MYKWSLAIIVALAACTSTSTTEKPWAKYEKFMNPTNLVLDSLPDTLAYTLDNYIKENLYDTANAKWCYIAANLHSKAGRLQDAAVLLENICTNYPSSTYAADAALSAAVNYENQGMTDHAKRMYGIFVNRYPNHPRVQEVKQVLEMLKNGNMSAEEQLEHILKNKN